MLYYNEYSLKNVNVYKHVMTRGGNVGVEELNIHQGDYLKLDTKEYWGVEKFNVIVGNPPYQPPTDRKHGATGNILWNKFVLNNLNVNLKL